MVTEPVTISSLLLERCQELKAETAELRAKLENAEAEPAPQEPAIECDRCGTHHLGDDGRVIGDYALCEVCYRGLMELYREQEGSIKAKPEPQRYEDGSPGPLPQEPDQGMVTANLPGGDMPRVTLGMTEQRVREIIAEAAPCVLCAHGEDIDGTWFSICDKHGDQPHGNTAEIMRIAEIVAGRVAVTEARVRELIAEALESVCERLRLVPIGRDDECRRTILSNILCALSHVGREMGASDRG